MINKDKWAEIIKDWGLKEFPKAVEREIKINLETGLNRAVSIIGPRRTGKTYEMFILARALTEKFGKKRTIYINFERADLGAVNYTDLVLMLETYYEIYPENKKKRIWLFLDEIQNVTEWERFVRTCLDEGIKVIISGSSSKLLSKEIATSMRGRNISYRLFPFSFREYLKTKGFEKKTYLSSEDKSKIVNFFENYLIFGGYPEAVIYTDERSKIIADIFETAILKDIIERHKIRNLSVMRLLIKALLSSKEFSVNKFYNHIKSQGMKIGKNVLYNYLEYLEDAFFVFSLRKFNLSYKKADQSIPKIYFIDNGILTENKIDDKGRLMENLVYIELLRRELDISYYQTITKEEVDFLIKEGKKVKQLIQVCWDIENFATYEREVKSLLKASKEFKCDNLLILTKHAEKQATFKGKKMKIMPVWKWLLEV
ncbi:MAG: ATP-binding protein [archaeon]